jgi:hypothetical protein
MTRRFFQHDRNTRWRRRRDRPDPTAGRHPPALEVCVADATNVQAFPIIATLRPSVSGEFLDAASNFLERADDHGPCIAPQSGTQGLERTFLGAPDQSGQARSRSGVCPRNASLLTGVEIAGNEGRATRFDRFQITTERDPAKRHGAYGSTKTVAEGDRNVGRLVEKVSLRRSRRGGAHLNFPKGPGNQRQVKACR